MLVLQIVLALAVYDIAKKLLICLAKVAVEYGCKKDDEFLDECLESDNYALSDIARKVKFRKMMTHKNEKNTIGFNR